MEKKRARRRRELRRMKAKAVRIFRRPRFYNGDPNEWDKINERLANHLAVCSSWCCGNPRRWFGELTMQERRFEAAWVADRSEDWS